MELRNKVCLVTGATGAIGSAIAKRFCQEGARLALTYCSQKPEKLNKELSLGAREVAWHRLDVADWKEVEEVVANVKTDFGGIDVLVNCAGIIGPIGPLESLDLRAWARTLEVNLVGTVHLAHAVLPILKERGRGKLIFFSGGGGAYGRPYLTAYSSSKAALVRFTESLAQELEATDIQVNAVAPGPIESHMWDEMRSAGAVGGPKLLEELKRMEETGGASADRAAALSVFLASDRSNRVTGRLLSAIWDDWEHMDEHIERLAVSDAWTLRRVPLV